MSDSYRTMNFNNFDDIQKKLKNLEEKEEKESIFVNKANALFIKNISSLQKYFPDIATKFASHQPSDRFNLFLNENGSANIVDYATKVPIYNSEPLNQVVEQVQKSIESPILTSINYSSLVHLENDADFVHVDLMKAIGESYLASLKNLKLGTDLSNKIPSIVIFGVGLGYHLSLLSEKVNAEFINIFEPEEDYFFASLFTFDWASYLGKIDACGATLYLSIGLSDDETYQALLNRTKNLGPFTIANSFYFQHYPSFKINSLIDKLKKEFHRIFMGWGFIDDQLMGLAHTIGNDQKKIPHFCADKVTSQPYKNMPIFIIANGPSLDNDIEVIKQLKDQVLIFSCNSATTALLNNGIKPDFHIALERTRETFDFLDFYLDEEIRKNINLLTLNVMHPEVADLFKWSGVALKGREAGTCLYQVSQILSHLEPSPTLAFCNPLVGNLGLSYALSLGFKDLYLFGMDNGYITPENHHSKFSMYYNNEGEAIHNPITMGNEFEVQGNFRNVVLTDHFLYTGKKQIDSLLLSYEGKDISCYNCSDGAKLEGSIALESDNIIINHAYKKEDVIDYICNELFSPSVTSLELDKNLFFEEFSKLCMEMADILKPNPSSVTEAVEQVIYQFRYLTCLTESQYSHHYLLLEGEVLYVNSVIVNLLFSYSENDNILECYEKIRVIWCDFLREAPNLYIDKWNKYSEHVFDTSNL